MTPAFIPCSDETARLLSPVARLLPFWGESMVGYITGNTCRGYVRQRVKTGAVTSSARRELAVLRAAARHCEREGYLTRAPAVVLPEVRQREHRVYSRGELARIIVASRREQRCRDHLPLFILLGAYTGKRSGAIRLWASFAWSIRVGSEGSGWKMRKNKWHIVSAYPETVYCGDPVVAWAIDTSRFNERDDCSLYAYPVIPIVTGAKDNENWPGDLTFGAAKAVGRK